MSCGGLAAVVKKLFQKKESGTMKRMLLVLGMLACALMLTGRIVLEADELAEEVPSLREGITAILESDLVSLVNNIIEDARYEVLEKVVKERRFHLDPRQAKGLLYPEGYQTVFVPVLDRKGSEKGFLASSDNIWTLSIAVGKGNKQILESFVAEIGDGGQVIVEVGSLESVNHNARDSVPVPMIPPELQVLSTGYCVYVSKVGLNFGCWSPSDNPFGYYYVWTYRFGPPIDPWNHSWRVCWWGSAHICPRYDNAGSPWYFPVCGFAPRHPEG